MKLSLQEHVFEIGRLNVEGEPDNFTWVCVLDLFGDDRTKAARINKRFFGGTATVTEWPAFEMVRLECRSDKALDKYEGLFVKFLNDGGWGKDWLPGGAARRAKVFPRERESER